MQLLHNGKKYMAKKRFSRYKFALKANDGEAAGSSALGKYKNYATGATKLSYPRSAASATKGLVDVNILPFAAFDNDLYYLSQMSNRASDEMGSIPIDATFLNHLTISAGKTSIVYPKFRAARAVFKTGTLGKTRTTSKITGVSYNKETSRVTYSYPFGRKASTIDANNNFLAVVAGIKGKGTPANSTNELTIYPELFS